MVTGTLDYDNFVLFFCISVTMALLAGSLILPCYFLLSEEKSVMGSMLAYPLSVALIMGLTSVIRQRMAALSVGMAVGALAFTVSWVIAGKVVAAREV